MARTTTDHEGISRARLRHDWQSVQSQGPDSPIPIPLAVAWLGLDSADQQRRIRAATATVSGAIQRTRARSPRTDLAPRWISGRELVLCGPRTDYRDVVVHVGLDISAEISRRVSAIKRDDSSGERSIRDDTSHRAGPTLVTRAPIGHAGMVGSRSEVARYPLGTPGCAAGQSRRPLASPGPYGLLQSGWTGLDIGGLARIDAIGGRAVTPQYRATVARRTRRGKKGGRKHK